jgi:hypothetical protein
MVTNSRRTVGEPSNLVLVPSDGKARRKRPRSLTGRVVCTVTALLALAAVLRYLPPTSRNSRAQAANIATGSTPDELQLGRPRMTRTPAGESLYLDGVVTNRGTDDVTAATVEVEFRDSRGQVVSSVQKPIVGVTRGGTDLPRSEFAGNPIQPNEMRFFRVAVEEVPPTWNHELPELKVVAVKAQ